MTEFSIITFQVNHLIDCLNYQLLIHYNKYIIWAELTLSLLMGRISINALNVIHIFQHLMSYYLRDLLDVQEKPICSTIC